MKSSNSTSDAFLDFLISSNEAAFVNGEYDTAYHLLASALHLSQSGLDYSSLQSIANIAEEQGSKIDMEHPEYHHSTQSAGRRGHGNIFAQLARHSNTASLIAIAKRKREKTA
jgi:hypothetical protein